MPQKTSSKDYRSFTRKPFLERFFKAFKVSQTKECWEWQRTPNANGYGVITNEGKSITASRASYEIYLGKIPKGKLVLHKCDNKLCVNPNHLYAGTQKQNIRDYLKSDNYKPPTGNKKQRGHKNVKAKLNEKKVLQIRFSSAQDIARKYKISECTVWAIKSKRTWSWLKD